MQLLFHGKGFLVWFFFFFCVASHGTLSSSIVLGSGPEHASVCGREVSRATDKLKKSPGTNLRLSDVIRV